MTERCWLAVLRDLLEAQKIIRHQGPETDFWLKESQHPCCRHQSKRVEGKQTNLGLSRLFHWGTSFTLFALCHLKSTWTDATSPTSTWVPLIKTLCGCLIYGYVKIVISLMYFTFSSLSPMCWPRLAFLGCHIKVRELYRYSPKILVVRVPWSSRKWFPGVDRHAVKKQQQITTQHVILTLSFHCSKKSLKPHDVSRTYCTAGGGFGEY